MCSIAWWSFSISKELARDMSAIVRRLKPSHHLRPKTTGGICISNFFESSLGQIDGRQTSTHEAAWFVVT